MMRLWKIVPVTALLLFASATSGANTDPDTTALHKCLAASAKADRFSGILAIGRGGTLLDSASFGHPDPEGRLPFSVDTRFNIASAGKMFTAVAIGQLVQQGRLAFDEPVRRILPGLPDDIGKVTIDQLLTHRSGLGDYLRPENREAIHAARTASALLPLAIQSGLAFAPGSKQQYSNSGYVVLGAVIEKLSGQTYADYVRTHILEPADMTTADLLGTAPHATAMTKHMPDGSLSTVPHPAPPIGGDRVSPAGGAFASARDMIKFGEALRSGKLLSARIGDQLWMPRVGGVSRENARVSYTYGFERMDFQNGAWTVGHGGGSLGINAGFELFPKSGNTIVALANYDPPSATEAMVMARRALLGQPPC